MRHLSQLRKAFHLFSTVRDWTSETRRFQWEVASPNTLYLDAEYADIRLSARDSRHIQAKVELRARFGWQLATDQDEAGVYIVARRKRLIGAIGRAKVSISLPPDVHISLKLSHCLLCLVDLNSALDFDPFA